MTAGGHDSIMPTFVVLGVPLVDLAERGLELLSLLGGHLGVDRRVVLLHVLNVPAVGRVAHLDGLVLVGLQLRQCPPRSTSEGTAASLPP